MIYLPKVNSYAKIKRRIKDVIRKIPRIYAWHNVERWKKLQKRMEEAFGKMEGKGTVPLFTHVEIETLNRCNGSCAFCPVNKHADIREYKKMSDELYEKIIGELHGLRYAGRLGLFSNNEPFLDKRIEAFAEIARKSLPNAFIYLYTNGSVLTLDRFINTIRYLDEIIIDNYNDDLVLNKNTKIINEYCEQHQELNSKVKIWVRKENEVLLTRAGQAPNNKKQETLPVSCVAPYTQFIIRPDGEISLCCNDAYGTVTMGDVSNRTIKEIWYSQEYSDIRDLLKQKDGREKIQLCKYCDSTFEVEQFINTISQNYYL